MEEDTKEVINFENLGYYIKIIEKVFDENGVNQIEQDLILTQTLARVRAKQKNVQAQDMMQSMPLGGLFKRLFKEKKDDDLE